MKKKTSKIIICIISLTMIVGTMSVTAFAEQETEPDSLVQEEVLTSEDIEEVSEEIIDETVAEEGTEEVTDVIEEGAEGVTEEVADNANEDEVLSTQAKRPDGFNYVGGQWRIYKDGKVRSTLTGIVYGKIDGKEAWYYVKDGVYTDVSGIAQKCGGTDKSWYYVRHGERMSYTGFTKKADGSSTKRYYVINGKKTSLTGLVSGTINGKESKYYINKGVFTRATGITKLARGTSTTWYFVSNGVYKKSTGLAKKADGSSTTKFYVKDGKLNRYTGEKSINGKKYYLYKGVVYKGLTYEIKKYDKSITYAGGTSYDYHEYPQLSGTAAPIKKINSAIKTAAVEFVDKNIYYSSREEDEKFINRTKCNFYSTMTVKTVYKKKNIFGVCYEEFWYKGGVVQTLYKGDTFSLKTGKKLTPLQVVDTKYADCEKLRSLLYQKLYNGESFPSIKDSKIASNFSKEYSSDDKIKNLRFYINENGDVVILFEPYELYSGMRNGVQVTIPGRYK